ncbi:MAG TPA: cytochrome c oxidase assembly protein [Solirubrobacteraceae bacterium]|jgi:putative membrane protein|nr:cytochrome c oxidase assembly protein [Solirubrobacteraceae bacterium]
MKPDLTWSFSPLVLVVALAWIWVYVRRWRTVRAAGSERAATEAPVWRLCCFIAATLVVVLALCSPIDSLSSQLFAAHMVQHMLLLDIAPILAILALTKVILRPVTRTVHTVERMAGPLAHPAFAVALYVGVIWAWHIPTAYDLAVRNDGVHILEHLSFLVVGSLYWWHLISPIRARMRLGGMGPIAYMATSKLLVGALGMGLAFAPVALYPYYEHVPQIWGLSALDDQGVAGLIMAVEQSLVMGVAIVVLFIRALAESEREQQRRERYELLA